MTAALLKKASDSPVTLSAFVEGPYGGLESMRSYGTALLFAGGVGITHQISHVRDLVGAWSEGSCSTRKVKLVWTVRNVEQLEWVKPWVDELLEMPMRGNALEFSFHVSRPNSQYDEAYMKEAGYPRHISFGRVDVRKVIEEEFGRRVGAMGISVCGPGGLADDVRSSARSFMEKGKVDFWEEAFTW